MNKPTLFSLSALSLCVLLGTAISFAADEPTPDVAAPEPPVAVADDKPNPTAPDADTATAPPKMTDITLIDADKGKTVQLKVGQRLLVRLGANPTTGYEWSAAKLDEKILAPDGEPEFDVPETELAGSPTVQTLFFRAKSAGKLKLELRYARPWEKDVEPLSIYRVNIVAVP